MNSKPKLPDFLIVGAAKSGTTSLWRYLSQHPEIFMSPNKEPRFFVYKTIRSINKNDPRFEFENRFTIDNINDYTGLFENAREEKALGEASTAYLYYYRESIPNIKEHLGDVKIIIILRNPVQRAYSAYIHMLESLWESDTFEQCLSNEEHKKAENWSHIHLCKDLGFFYEQVKAFLDNFSTVQIITLDELEADTQGTMKDIFRFLGVDDSFIPNTKKKFLKTKLPRSRIVYNYLVNKNNPKRVKIDLALHELIGRRRTLKFYEYIMTLNTKRTPPMKESTRIYLKDLYSPDIVKLQELLGRDLSMWLE